MWSFPCGSGCLWALDVVPELHTHPHPHQQVKGQGQVSNYRNEGQPLFGGVMRRCDRGLPEEVPREHGEGKHVGGQAVAARGEHLGRRVSAPDQRDVVVLIGIVRGQGRKEGGGEVRCVRCIVRRCEGVNEGGADEEIGVRMGVAAGLGQHTAYPEVPVGSLTRARGRPSRRHASPSLLTSNRGTRPPAAPLPASARIESRRLELRRRVAVCGREPSRLPAAAASWGVGEAD